MCAGINTMFQIKNRQETAGVLMKVQDHHGKTDQSHKTLNEPVLHSLSDSYFSVFSFWTKIHIFTLEKKW